MKFLPQNALQWVAFFPRQARYITSFSVAPTSFHPLYYEAIAKLIKNKQYTPGVAMRSGQLQGYQIVVMNNGHGMFFAGALVETLKEKYRIASKNMGKRLGLLRQLIHNAGLSNSTKNHAEFIEPPFLIDRHAAFFLHSRPEICQHSVQARERILALSGERETAVYMHLAGHYFLTDGHKFGCTFLAYDQDPEIHHAKALVFIEEDTADEIVRDVRENQASRLAGISKKEALMARVTQEGVRIQIVERHRSRRHEQSQT